MPATPLPFVRQLIPCTQLRLEEVGGRRRFVLSEPLTIADACDHPVQLSVYACLTSGVGLVSIQLEAAHSPDDGVYRFLGRSQSHDVQFQSRDRGLLPVHLAFSFPRGIPMRLPGLYRFQVVSGDDPLPGQSAEIRVLKAP